MLLITLVDTISNPKYSIKVLLFVNSEQDMTLVSYHFLRAFEMTVSIKQRSVFCRSSLNLFEPLVRLSRLFHLNAALRLVSPM